VKEYLSKLLTKEFHIPKIHVLHRVITSFNFTEKIFFIFFAICMSVTSLILLAHVNSTFNTPVPVSGGTLKEGIIGSPRFINPLLALSDADRDLVTLTYSGLMRADENGTLIPDLAESYTLSEDGKTYTFTLKDGLTFHDNVPLTTKDIAFTIARAQDPLLRSPKRVNWDGVTVSVIDDKTISFTLERPYAPFLENTTIGIVPKHVWESADSEEFPFSQFNTEPVGSGPYELVRTKRDASGIPQYYDLKPFKNYALGEPYISHIRIAFFSNEKDLLNAYYDNDIDQLHSINPQNADTLMKDGAIIKRTPLPRIFAVFFNQNESTLFASKSIRKALNTALDKEKIVQVVLGGYGVPLNSPIPPGLLDPHEQATISTSDQEVRLKEAEDILREAGWKRDEETSILEKESRPLSFAISTSNTPELKAAAEMVAETWNTLGADVTVKVFDTSDLNQNVIRPRKFEALLFGEVIGRDMDFFAFWHSSQRNDPGLNVALYTNITVDALLEKARIEQDTEKRSDQYLSFKEEVMKDIPAVFLYVPEFIYVISSDIDHIAFGQPTIPSDRFASIYTWNINSKNVWNFFKAK